MEPDMRKERLTYEIQTLYRKKEKGAVTEEKKMLLSMAASLLKRRGKQTLPTD